MSFAWREIVQHMIDEVNYLESASQGLSRVLWHRSWHRVGRGDNTGSAAARAVGETLRRGVIGRVARWRKRLLAAANSLLSSAIQSI
jgi:hypothetical protein